MTFKAIMQVLGEGSWGRFLFGKKCNKIRLSLNLESYLYMRIKNNIGGRAIFYLSISCNLR